MYFVRQVDVLCTHPMFGPDSGAGSWAGLNLMYERVRIAEDAERLQRVANFLAVRLGPGRWVGCLQGASGAVRKAPALSTASAGLLEACSICLSSHAAPAAVL